MKLTQDHCVKINSLEEYNRFAEIADQLGYYWSTGDKFTEHSVYSEAGKINIAIFPVMGIWTPLSYSPLNEIRMTLGELESMIMVEKIKKFLETC